MSFPLVSVIIPTHNRPGMLAEALASVRAQTFTDYEIIVVSNGESDDMRRASRDAASGCVYLELDRGNVSAARNFGMERAKGEWIAILDDDDLWPPNKLERQIAEAEATGADMSARIGRATSATCATSSRCAGTRRTVFAQRCHRRQVSSCLDL